jgi:hypothetical protein
MTVFERMERELEAMGDAGKGALAASVLKLAEEMDNPKNCGTSKSMINKELRETLAALRALAPPKVEEDEVEQARKRRVARLGKSAAGSAPSS